MSMPSDLANGGVCTCWAHRNTACPTPNARLALATLVQQRFGSDAFLVGYSHHEDDIVLWDVRTRDGRMLWNSRTEDFEPWGTIADAVQLLVQCTYAVTERGDDLTFPLGVTA
jgi:hypothetical protein